MNKISKIIILLLVTFLISLIFSFSVSAFTTDEVIIENELQKNLLYIDDTNNISIKGSEFIKLVSNTSKLDKLLQSDNCVYDNVLIKVDNKTVKASADYSNSTNKALEIVNIENQKYVKCPIIVAEKKNNLYYPSTYSTTLNLQSEDTSITNEIWTTSIFEGDKSFNTVIPHLESVYNGKNDYYGGEGWNSGSRINCDTNMVKGDCYIIADISCYAGDKVEMYPFGTLYYMGESTEIKGYYKYKALITDKSILQNDILARLVIPQYNTLHICKIHFMGDKVELESNPISVANKENNIILSGTTMQLPSNVKLMNEKIESGKIYDEISNMLNNSISNINIYDMKLISTDVTFQPNGKVKVSILIPEEYNLSKIALYGLKDGNKVKYDVTIENFDNANYVILETDYIGTFVLGEEVIISDNNDSDNNNSDNNVNGDNENSESNGETNTIVKEEKKEHILDDEPKTGNENKLSFLSMIFTIFLTSAGIIISKI